jgi:hypothetical protein
MRRWARTHQDNQDGLPSGRREVERPPIIVRWSKEYPEINKQLISVRRERPLRPSHVVDGGGDASQSYQGDRFEFERPYCGPSHVVEGGGAEFKPFYSEHHEVKLPTESRKEELRHKLSEINQHSSHDSRLYSLLWRIQGLLPSNRRSQVIKERWRSYGPSQASSLNQTMDLPHQDNLSLALKSFTLNDFLETQDELYTLEHPMRPPPIRSWGHRMVRRSSAVTVGPGSLSSSIVGSESGSGTGLTDTCVASRNPVYTGDAFSLRGGL